MRAVCGVLIVLFVSASAVTQEQPRVAAADAVLVQEFIDAEPGAARERLIGETPAMRAPEFRIAVQNSGRTHATQGRRVEAVHAYEAALELAALTNAPRTTMSALIGLGMVYGQAGDYRNAAKYLGDAMTRAEAAKDEEMIAAAGNNLGNVYRRRGELEAALEAYQRTLTSNEAAGREEQAGRTLNNIGLVHQEIGDFRSALEYYLRSLAIKERVSPPDDVISTIGNIGSVYALQGNGPQAVDYLERALTLAERAKNPRLMTGIVANIGRILIDERRYDDAEKRLLTGLKVAEQGSVADNHAGILASLGRLEIQRGRAARAAEYLVQARALFDQIGDPIGAGRVLTSLARLELDGGRPAAALELAEQARRTLAAVGTPTALIDAESILGDTLTALRRWDEATTAYERAIELTERGLALVAGDAEDRMRYLDGGTAPYFGLAQAYASAGRAADALRAAERGRARVLLDMLAGARPGGDRLTAADRERQLELDAAIAELNQRFAADRQRSRGSMDPALHRDLDRLRRSRDEFYLGLDARHPQLRFARGDAPLLTVEGIAQTLPRGAALVEIIVGSRDAWIVVLTPRANGPPRQVVKKSALSASRLLDLAAQFTKQVASRDLSFAANARALYDALFAPIDAELDETETLVIVPHGALWVVPFQALQTPRGRYLIEERAIAYVPSASALHALTSRRRPHAAQPRVVAFGDPRGAGSTSPPLPNAAREARDVAAVYGIANATVAIESEATESRFREVAPAAEILHIATHGVIDNASPLFSYVMLAGPDRGSRNADGRLEGREVINMRLGADLVVLSACETARGRIASGEGVVGLSWALFAAGASTAAVSLWQVDSTSTTALMTAFHRQRQGSIAAAVPAPTAQGLRAAQRQLLSTPEYRHPFYWAGFVVVGVP